MKAKQSNMRSDNQGFSLIEIIIVVAIMATMSGVLGFGLPLITGKPADECASKLSSNLKHAQTLATGKQSVTVEIKNDDAGNIFAQTTSVKVLDNTGTTETDTQTSIIGVSGVTVEFYVSDGAGGVTLATTLSPSSVGAIRLTYDRITGAISTTEVLNGSVYVATEDIMSIKITKGNKTRYINITPVTGNIELE